MHHNNFTGTGVALVTPFNNDGTVDYTALRSLVNFVIDGKVDYLVALGTTSEVPTLSKEEKKLIIELIVETANKRVPVVVGAGGNNTSEIINNIKELENANIDGILSVSPYYNKPIQRGIYEHFKAIATSTKLPIILYNVPGRTGSNMCADTTLALAKEFNNIVAIKEASGNFEQIIKIIKNKPEGFNVISGDDLITLPLIALGSIGVISVIGNVMPFEISELSRLCLAGDYVKARELNNRLSEIIELLFVEGNPGGVKAAMHSKGLIENVLRLPLVTVSDNTYQKLAKLVG